LTIISPLSDLFNEHVFDSRKPSILKFGINDLSTAFFTFSGVIEKSSLFKVAFSASSF
jgi:hypothetical protein